MAGGWGKVYYAFKITKKQIVGRKSKLGEKYIKISKL